MLFIIGHTGKSACKTICINKFIDGSANIEDSMDLSDILHINSSIIFGKKAFLNGVRSWDTPVSHIHDLGIGTGDGVLCNFNAYSNKFAQCGI